MKKCIALLTLTIALVSWTNSNDCRIFSFGVSPETVMSRETAIFMKKEEVSHNLVGLTFVEHTSNANFLHTYTFHNGKLNGLKSKKLSTIGDNSYVNALSDFREAFARYNSNCSVKIKEKTDSQSGLKSFALEMKTKKIFVNMVHENSEYFLVESVLQK